jgi:hypothetical protein
VGPGGQREGDRDIDDDVGAEGGDELPEYKAGNPAPDYEAAWDQPSNPPVVGATAPTETPAGMEPTAPVLSDADYERQIRAPREPEVAHVRGGS